MKNIAILGAGESGLGAAMLAKKAGYAIFVSDAGKIQDARKEKLQDMGIPFEEGVHTQKRILSADYIIKSPGIPESSEIVKMASKEGIPVIDELEFAAMFSNGKVVAITGTNGKTTTTLLTYHLMKNAGLDVGLAGNVGQSWAAQLTEGDHDWWVIECSSFQIDGLLSFRPTIAMITNITPDHLDRYGYKIENYINSKMSLFKNMTSKGQAIYYAEDPLTLQGLKGRKIRATQYKISLKSASDRGGFENGEMLVVHAGDKTVEIQKEALPLPGTHNVLNSLFAATAAVLAGVSQEQLIEGFKSFKNAPHRLELIREVSGVKFVNDSKGTNVEATFYALGSFDGPLIWIAGGVDKGNDYSVLTPLVREKVKTLICLGKDNEKLKKAFGANVPELKETQDIAEAVKWGLEVGKPGDVVLLSPACASFDLFKNYEDRGNQFRAAVENLKSHINA
ncbi:UDP-N-acetylmuramoyl-L-alanine--D-glutamate ligase [Algoriphagus sp. CAU 1675]|uniref:UDP-N-acetylmuramoyl-L-alanine--D-glutamate ligase n=1 Tax=Algoriphagus sp. CAU 1675 TaxID=3032597 RepID=UPI0023DBE17A|nr:UDP-N-acetylmuramoyl-L-alanine--D-glutamate ligase [Algoriphagus sp. CAU 1675]MDF2156845.1 UDP-N-acetylmuramoyl-L-alanine--D-glutamate ligase [Algoriphagus sp. CAU 1675]